VPFESLYVHVPFCRAKCGYCAFYSTPRHDRDLRRRYLVRLERELALRLDHERALASVYIGGGTPSVLEPEELTDLVDMIARHIRRAPDCEWTLEANPDSLTPEKLARAAAAGVNRISLGIQSFQPRLRRTLQRQGTLHGLDDLIGRLDPAGIRQLSFDLMYAVPGQSVADFESDLRRALEYPVSHLSAYALTIEEHTALGRAVSAPVADRIFLRQWRLLDDLLGQAGLRRYEISNFARPGSRCRHNEAIWHGGTYLGIGPAACSFDGIKRWCNPADLGDWLAGVPPEIDALPPEARAAEILAFGLRTVDGWDRQRYRRRTGYVPEEIRGAAIRGLEADGLLQVDTERIAPTGNGLLFNDVVIERLL
jgi:oxygen-independent coproporphyrinogen-3 oxidase